MLPFLPSLAVIRVLSDLCAHKPSMCSPRSYEFWESSDGGICIDLESWFWRKGIFVWRLSFPYDNFRPWFGLNSVGEILRRVFFLRDSIFQNFFVFFHRIWWFHSFWDWVFASYTIHVNKSQNPIRFVFLPFV